MFGNQDRDRLRERLVRQARNDPDIIGAAFTGWHASGDVDRWSDLDLVVGVGGEPVAVANRWTSWLYVELGTLHHWDLPSGSRKIVRVFLLPNWLEADLTFAPAYEFGPRGPQWETIFGDSRKLEPFSEPDRNTTAGLGWHHLLHAFVALERRRWWQAEYWISATRSQVLTLAALRLGCPTSHAKGAHLLPDEVTARLEATLVRDLTERELARALAAVTSVYIDELRTVEQVLAERLEPWLAQFVG